MTRADTSGAMESMAAPASHPRKAEAQVTGNPCAAQPCTEQAATPQEKIRQQNLAPTLRVRGPVTAQPAGVASVSPARGAQTPPLRRLSPMALRTTLRV